ncbi:MAG: hypothetical protein ACLGIJ_02655 [Candidatus Limnocylindria bacterium]
MASAHDDPPRPGTPAPDDPVTGPGPPGAPAHTGPGADLPPLPPAGGTTFRFLLVAGMAVLLTILTYSVLVATEPGQRIENLALRGAELRSDAERAAALGRLSIVTVAIFGIALVAVLGVGFLRGRERLAFMVAGTMGASVVLAELLKEWLSRPALVEGPIWLLRNSFPSGSAAVAASIAIGAVLVAPDRLRWIVLPIGAVFAGLIVDAVQTAGWHRLSDTVGGVLLVIAAASLGLAALATRGLVHPSPDARIDRRVRAILLVGGSAVVVLGALLVVLPGVFPLLAAPDGARRSILQTAFPLLGLGVTVLALVLFATSIDGYTLGRVASGSDRPAAPKASSGAHQETAGPSSGPTDEVYA